MNWRVLAGCFLCSTAAWAGKGGVAVLDISGTGIESNLLPTLTEVLTVEIDNLGMYKVIGGRDVQAMLGFERQKDVVGCTDAACLAEIGGALGVDRIVASHIGRVGSTYVVNIKLINIRMADTEARVYETVRGEVDALIATIRKSVDKLLGRRSKAAEALGVVAKTDGTEAAPEPAESTESAAAGDEVAATRPSESPPEVVEAETSGKSIGWLPITLWATGGVAAGVAVVMGVRAKQFEEDTTRDEDPADGVYDVGAQAAIDKARKNAIWADVMFGVAGLAVAGGFLAWLLAPEPAQKTAWVPVVAPNRVGVAFSAQF